MNPELDYFGAGFVAGDLCRWWTSGVGKNAVKEIVTIVGPNEILEGSYVVQRRGSTQTELAWYGFLTKLSPLESLAVEA